MTKRKIYHVTKCKGGGWDVKEAGTHRCTEHSATKQEAIVRGRKLAQKSGLGQLIVHKLNGRIQTEYTYGSDPKHSRG
jgi:hypothetical protein